MTQNNDGNPETSAADLLALALARLLNCQKTLANLREVERVAREAQARERERARGLAWSLRPVVSDLLLLAREAEAAGDSQASGELAALLVGMVRAAKELEKLARRG